MRTYATKIICLHLFSLLVLQTQEIAFGKKKTFINPVKVIPKSNPEKITFDNIAWMGQFSIEQFGQKFKSHIIKKRILVGCTHSRLLKPKPKESYKKIYNSTISYE